MGGGGIWRRGGGFHGGGMGGGFHMTVVFTEVDFGWVNSQAVDFMIALGRSFGVGSGFSRYATMTIRLRLADVISYASSDSYADNGSCYVVHDACTLRMAALQPRKVCG